MKQDYSAYVHPRAAALIGLAALATITAGVLAVSWLWK